MLKLFSVRTETWYCVNAYSVTPSGVPSVQVGSLSPDPQPISLLGFIESLLPSQALQWPSETAASTLPPSTHLVSSVHRHLVW